MRAALRRLVDEDWIVILACGLALGYAALNVAQALGQTLTTAFERNDQGLFGDGSDTGPLAFRLGSHLVDLGPLVAALVAFAFVLAAAAAVVALLHRSEETPRDVA